MYLVGGRCYIVNIRTLIGSKLVKNGLWLLVLQIFNTVIPLLTLPYITRIVSASDYGVFSLALNWIGYFQIIVEYGFALYGTKKIATCSDDRELTYIRSSILFARIILLCICLICFYMSIALIPMSLNQEKCMKILFLMVVSSVFQQTWLFHGMSDMKPITIINVVSRIASMICIFVFVKTPGDLYKYAFFYSSNFLLARLFEFCLASKKFKIKICKVRWRNVTSVLKEAWSLFISSAITRLFSNIGITILGFITIEEVVGAYAAIVKIPNIITLLFGAVSQAIYPSMCKAFEVSFQKGYNRVKEIGTPVICTFTIIGSVLMILHKPIVLIAYGTEYAQYSLMLIPFVCWTLLGIVNNFLGIQILVASGHQKEYSLDFLISIIVMVSLMLILGKIIGGYGIAVASMLSELCLSMLLTYHVTKFKRNI